MAERLTRTTLVAQAADLADEIGLGALTITRVGQAVGIAPPGVYRHVTDVADLRRAIGALAASEAARELSAATSGRAGTAALTAVGTTLRRWAAAHPGRYEALQVAPDPDDAEGRARANEVVAALATALRAYALTGDDLTDAIRFLRSTVHGFITLEQRDGFKDPRDPDRSFGRILVALDAALRGWTGA